MLMVFVCLVCFELSVEYYTLVAATRQCDVPNRIQLHLRHLGHHLVHDLVVPAAPRVDRIDPVLVYSAPDERRLRGAATRASER